MENHLDSIFHVFCTLFAICAPIPRKIVHVTIFTMKWSDSNAPPPPDFSEMSRSFPVIFKRGYGGIVIDRCDRMYAHWKFRETETLRFFAQVRSKCRDFKNREVSNVNAPNEVKWLPPPPPPSFLVIFKRGYGGIVIDRLAWNCHRTEPIIRAVVRTW